VLALDVLRALGVGGHKNPREKIGDSAGEWPHGMKLLLSAANQLVQTVRDSQLAAAARIALSALEHAAGWLAARDANEAGRGDTGTRRRGDAEIGRVVDGEIGRSGNVSTSVGGRLAGSPVRPVFLYPHLAVEAGARRFAMTLGRAMELTLLIKHAQWSQDHEQDGSATASARRFASSGIDLI